MVQDNFNQRVLKIRDLLSKRIQSTAGQVAETNAATPDGSGDQRENRNGWSDFNQFANAPIEKFSDFSDFNNAPTGNQAFHALNT